jgi:hypothetical protein
MPRSVRSSSPLRFLAVVVLAACGPGPELGAIDLTRHDVTLSATAPTLTREAHEIGESANGHSTSGVVAGSSGPGVTLSLTGDASSSTVTDSTGFFRFDGLADGTYQVTPQKAGYRFQPPSVAFTVKGSDLEEQNFLAFPESIAHGVSGVISRAPGLTITVGLAGASLTTEAESTGAGEFEFQGLPDGVYRLTPALHGYSFTPPDLVVNVAGADVSGVEFMAHVEP